MRAPTGMSGTSLPTTAVNLANQTTNSDVIYPPLHTGTSSLNDLNTSLWSISIFNNASTQSTNGATINMQAIDTIGTTGSYYYAIRVSTDASNLYYGNINLMCLKLN
jgi:hypothetical protein